MLIITGIFAGCIALFVMGTVLFALRNFVRKYKAAMIVPDPNCKNLDPELKKMGFKCACRDCTSF